MVLDKSSPHALCFAVCCLAVGVVEFAAGSGVRKSEGSSELGVHGLGAAVASGLSGGKPSQNTLLPINVTFDPWYNPAWEGASLVVDRLTRRLQAHAGTNPDGAIAWARFADELSSTGWMELIVETTENVRVSNSMRMYGAGFVEGLLTATRLSQFYSNFWQVLAQDAEGSATLVNIQNMMQKEIEYVKKKSGLQHGFRSAEPSDSYWKQVRYLFLQLWGLKDGYNVMAGRKKLRKLELLDMLIINSHAELPELMQAYLPKAMKQRQAFQALSARRSAFLQQDTKGSRGRHAESSLVARHSGNASVVELSEADHDWEQRLARRGHCSALVRIAPEQRDLFVGHTTWSDYGKMTRIFKYYNFRLPGAGTAASHIGFSSYPGCISSTDDFYMMDSGLVTMDTSLEMLNSDLYDRIPEFPANPHIPSFMHIMAVNRLAHTAMDWTRLFASRNDGMPSAQWIVVNYNEFSPGEAIRDNTVRIVEQIPGISRQADISSTVDSQGYWASYNRPFFPEVRRASGHAAAEDRYGALYSFSNGPRATIFKHVSGSIDNMFHMRGVMNRNTFPNEGVLPAEPGHAISARMDLDMVNHLPNGGIDAKVLDRCLFRLMQCQAISGPSHDNQPVFRWQDGNGTELFAGWPHLGLPNTWNFGWAQITPSKLLPHAVDEHAC